MQTLPRPSRRSDYWDWRLTERPDLTGVGHAGHSARLNAAMYALKRDILLEVLQSFGVELSNVRVLDAGCGTGYFSEVFLSQGARVVGIDFSETAVRAAKQRSPKGEFHLMDLVSDDLVSLGEFDVLCSLDVLIHIVDDADARTALDKLLQRARSGAWFVCTDTFLPSRESHSYLRNRPLQWYAQALEARDFEIQEVRPIYFLLGKSRTIDKVANVLPKVCALAETALHRIGTRRNWGNVSMLFARHRPQRALSPATTKGS